MTVPQKTSQSETDELARTIDEYRSKVDEIVRKEKERLRQLIDKESNHIISGAWQKAEEIIAESQQKAQKIREETENQARKEASEIVDGAQRSAQLTINEAEERTRKEAKNRTKSETEKIISKAKEMSNDIISHARQAAEKEANDIINKARKEATHLLNDETEKCRADAQTQSEQFISKARKKAERAIDDIAANSMETNKMIMEIMHQTETIIDKFKNELQIELGEATKVIAVAKNKLEQTVAEIDEKGETIEVIPNTNEALNKNAVLSIELKGEKQKGGNGSKPLFKGQLELRTMSSYDYLQIKKLRNFLVNVPNIKYAGEYTSEEEAMIVFKVEEPLPLVDILSSFPLVEKVVDREDHVELVLQG